MKNMFSFPGIRSFVFVHAAAALLASTAVIAQPTVDGYTISWPLDGWYQVQDQETYESVCEGGSSCTAPRGVYIVVNHHTGERFENICVPEVTDDSASMSDTHGSGPTDGTPVSSSSVPSPVAQTGQTIVSRFGDDASMASGATVDGVRYRDNGDGTFTDELTGITWLSVRECIVKHSWADAIDYALAMSGDGLTCPGLTDGSMAGDWRLPNIKELQSLVDYSETYPVWGTGVPYSGLWGEIFPWDEYWSSTSFTLEPENFAWGLEASLGRIEILEKNEEEWTWIVR